MAACGHNAAQRILKDRRRRRGPWNLADRLLSARG
jgi:hypothetical protein